MQHTTNYNLNKPEGSDLFAPLTDTNPNWDTIDAGMQANKAASVFPATEVISAGVHAITRSVAGAAMFRFTAVGNYASGDTFTVDSVAVSAVSAKGETLTAGAWITGAEVLGCLKGTVLTLYVSAASTDAQTLEGHAASYFGTAAAVTQAQSDATAAGNVANSASVAANNAIAIAQAAGMSVTKIWENSTPTSDFADQTLALTTMPNNVKFFIVMQSYKNNDNPQLGCSGIVFPSVQSIVFSFAVSGATNGLSARFYTFDNSAKTVVINKRTGISTSFAIPLAIYAVK